MTKGIEALERIIQYNDLRNPVRGQTDLIDIIEKELKALEIIKKKLSPLARFTFYPMSQKEYDLLKEVLEDD